jgi:Zn-dependent peptidase ImmA (M78 family)
VSQLSLFEDSQRLRPWLRRDQDHVVAVAAGVLDELGVVPPVDPEMILSYLGVSRVVAADIPWAGYLFQEDGELIVKVRHTDSWTRQRFSMLHEAGHTFLPGFDRAPRFRCDPGRGQREGRSRPETLSDIAASELLFPRDAFIADLSGRPTFDLVEGLADKYRASVTATALRVGSLAPVDSMLIALEWATKPSQRNDETVEPALRVQWTSPGGRWPFVPHHKSASVHGPLVRALAGEAIEETATLRDLCGTDERLHLSARRYAYNTREGAKTRVLAIYSRSWGYIQN